MQGHCPHCKTRFSGAARVCRNCGRELPEPGVDQAAEPDQVQAYLEIVPSHVGVRVCSACGRCVPARHAVCVACEEARPRIVPPRTDGAYWARVECDYFCARRSMRAPLSAFTESGQVACSWCDGTHELPLVFWRTILKLAHEVADLAGPDPEGRNPSADVSIAPTNPWRHVGIEVADAPLAEDGARADDDLPEGLKAGPGWPLCPSCGEPVDATWTAGEYGCRACGLTATSALPASAARVNRGLRAVLGFGAARVRTDEAVGVIALLCPTCTAPLRVTEGATEAACTYCKTAVLVRRPAAAVRATPSRGAHGLWLLFAGPSRRRIDLEARTRAGI